MALWASLRGWPHCEELLELEASFVAVPVSAVLLVRPFPPRLEVRLRPLCSKCDFQNLSRHLKISRFVFRRLFIKSRPLNYEADLDEMLFAHVVHDASVCCDLQVWALAGPQVVHIHFVA